MKQTAGNRRLERHITYVEAFALHDLDCDLSCVQGAFLSERFAAKPDTFAALKQPQNANVSRGRLFGGFEKPHRGFDMRQVRLGLFKIGRIKLDGCFHFIPLDAERH